MGPSLLPVLAATLGLGAATTQPPPEPRRRAVGRQASRCRRPHARAPVCPRRLRSVSARERDRVPGHRRDPRTAPCATVRRAVPRDRQVRTLRARLQDPIAGRELNGQSLSDAPLGSPGRERVPRMIGLQAGDARFALRAHGLRVRGDRKGVVRGQDPRPGARIRDRREVTLETGAKRRPLPVRFARQRVEWDCADPSVPPGYTPRCPVDQRDRDDREQRQRGHRPPAGVIGI